MSYFKGSPVDGTAEYGMLMATTPVPVPPPPPPPSKRVRTPYGAIAIPSSKRHAVGACCAECADGMGALTAGQFMVAPQFSAATPAATPSRAPLLIALAGVGVAGFLIVRKLRKRK